MFEPMLNHRTLRKLEVGKAGKILKMNFKRFNILLTEKTD